MRFLPIHVMLLAACPALAQVADGGNCLRGTPEATEAGPKPCASCSPPLDIRYTLGSSCYVTLRIIGYGEEERTYATLVDHELQDAGEHSVGWNGRDSSGNAVPWSTTSFALYVDAVTAITPMDPCAYVKRHPNLRADLKVDIPSPAPDSTHSLPFRAIADVLEGYRGMGDTLGYTVRWYIDEDRDPFHVADAQDLPTSTVMVDTSHWGTGDHILRACFSDSHKHYGSASVRVTFVDPEVAQ